MVKVSVLVPVYNVEQYLKQCLNSILNQTLRDIEIICVDDGSTDMSGRILDGYREKDNRVIVIHKENSGYGASMNLAIKRAVGKYIGIVESDDFIEPEMYERLFYIAEEFNLDCVKSEYYSYTEKYGRQYVNAFAGCRCNEVFGAKDNLNKFTRILSIWAALYNRKFLLDKGIYFLETPGASYQDTSFAFKVRIVAERNYYLREAYLNYRMDNEKSSVKSKGKAYAVCDEIAECKRYLRGLGEEQYNFFAPYLAHEMVADYLWNIDRISYEYVEEFTSKIINEYRQEIEQGHIDFHLFNEKEKEHFVEIAEIPNKFVREHKQSCLFNECKNIDIYMQAFSELIGNCNDIYIYGAGILGNRLKKTINQLNEKASVQFLITRKDSKNDNKDNIMEITDKALDKNRLLIIAVTSLEMGFDMMKRAKTEKFQNIVYLDEKLRKIVYDT